MIRLSVLRVIAWDGVAEIGAIEGGSFVDLACEETLSQRAERNEADSKFLKGCQHLLFSITVPKRVFALDCGDPLNGFARRTV